MTLTCLAGMRAQEFQIVHLHGVFAPDGADHARHGIRMAAAIQRRARIVEVHAFERGGETIRITLAADFAVGDDVEPGLLLHADGQYRGIVLRLGEIGLRNAPQLECAHARRKPAGEFLAIDEPLRLRQAAHQRGRKQFARVVHL